MVSELRPKDFLIKISAMELELCLHEVLMHSDLILCTDCHVTKLRILFGQILIGKTFSL